MTVTTDLLDELMAKADAEFPASGWPPSGFEAHDCDGCGEVKDDVDLWASDSETGEELWLCESCAEI